MRTILVALHMRKRNGCARATPVARLIPDAAAAHDVVPGGTSCNEQPFVRWDQVAAVLHELRTHRWEMLPGTVESARVGVPVDQCSEASARSRVREHQTPLELVGCWRRVR